MTLNEKKKAAFVYFCKSYPNWPFMERPCFKSILPPSFSVSEPMENCDPLLPVSIEFFEYRMVRDYFYKFGKIVAKRDRIMCGDLCVSEIIE